MNVLRISIAICILIVSAWGIPLLSDVMGISSTLSFATFGSIMCFAAGILFHSGVREYPRW